MENDTLFHIKQVLLIHTDKTLLVKVIQNYRDRGLFIEALMLAKIKNDKEEFIKSLEKAIEILN